MKGDLNLELWLVWMCECGSECSVLSELLCCGEEMGCPGVAGCLSAHHHRGVGMETSAWFQRGLLLGCGSFFHILGLLVCHEEGLLTPVVLLQGRCRNPFCSIKTYSWCALPPPWITSVLDFEKYIYCTTAGQHL